MNLVLDNLHQTFACALCQDEVENIQAQLNYNEQKIEELNSLLMQKSEHIAHTEQQLQVTKQIQVTVVTSQQIQVTIVTS